MGQEYRHAPADEYTGPHVACAGHGLERRLAYSLSLDRLTFDQYQALEWGFVKSPEHKSKEH
jgi:hypothetical protein